MISNRPVHYKLSYCAEESYATFVSKVRSKETVARLCYFGVEGLRLFLSLRDGIPYVTFYKRVEKTWERITKVPRMRALSLPNMLHSAQEFEQELCETFFFAYPRAEEAFYETLPSHKEVLSALACHPNDDMVSELMLICSWDDMTSVDDAEGIATITCDDGTVCIPFDLVKGRRVLQMERAKFHPYSMLSSLTESFFDWCSNLHSRLSSMSLNGFLGKLDRLF